MLGKPTPIVIPKCSKLTAVLQYQETDQTAVLPSEPATISEPEIQEETKVQRRNHGRSAFGGKGHQSGDGARHQQSPRYNYIHRQWG